MFKSTERGAENSFEQARRVGSFTLSGEGEINPKQQVLLLIRGVKMLGVSLKRSIESRKKKKNCG